MMIKACFILVILFTPPVSFFALSRTEEGNARSAFGFCAMLSGVAAVAIILIASSI